MNMRHISATMDAAKSYKARGWATALVEFGGKAPSMAVRGPHNIAVVLGSASGHLADVDLDDPIAIKLAPQFLPATLTFGRGGEVRHMLFRAKDAPTHRYTDATDKKTLVELRANSSTGVGMQVVVPPSIHPSGQRVEWMGGDEPAEVDAVWLHAQVCALAAAVLDAKHGEGNAAVAEQRAKWLSQVQL